MFQSYSSIVKISSKHHQAAFVDKIAVSLHFYLKTININGYLSTCLEISKVDGISGAGDIVRL